MMSDAFGKTMFKPNSSESGALGVALLAGVASGIYPDIAGASTDIVVKTASNKPDMKLNELYRGYFGLYKNIYLSLKADFKTLAGLDK
jgi:xylulokinase